jgi:hypothetical protein
VGEAIEVRDEGNPPMTIIRRSEDERNAAERFLCGVRRWIGARRMGIQAPQNLEADPVPA